MSEQNQNPNPVPVDQSAQIAALNSKVEALTNYISEIGPFVNDSATLITAISKNPELKESVMRATNDYRNPPQPTAQPVQSQQYRFDPYTGQPIGNPQPVQQQQQQPTQEKKDPTIQSMDIKMREDIITQIETKYGYSQLPKEKRSELRQQVEQRLKSWNNSVITAPINQLPKLLEDAYVLTDIGKAKEEGRLDGLIEARNNEFGMLPTMGSVAQKTEDTGLSSEQQTFVKKWNLNEDKVADRLKEFKATGVMTYKPKEEVARTPQQTPSGSPTPPQTQ